MRYTKIDDNLPVEARYTTRTERQWRHTMYIETLKDHGGVRSGGVVGVGGWQVGWFRLRWLVMVVVGGGGCSYTFCLALSSYDPGNEPRCAYNPRNTYKRVHSEI